MGTTQGVPSEVADDLSYKHGLLLGALDELVEKWTDTEARYSGTVGGQVLTGALNDLRQVVRIHG